MTISRRKFFAGAGAAAGALATSSSSKAAVQTSGVVKEVGLPPVWGEDFLYQWSPPDNVKRDISPGPGVIRLSNSQDITNREGSDYSAMFKTMRAAGWTACEAASSAWLSRKMPDSEVTEMKAQLKANDVLFYNIHCAGNIIAPGSEAEQWQRHIIDAIHSAEECGCKMVLTHTGSMFPGRDKAHPLNWSKQAWERSVGALKNIAKSTSGSKILIGIEPVNTEAINNPWAMKRLREDVGDSRIVCGLDITNMVNPSVAFRMTELMNTTFELLHGMIGYIHAKDFVWNDMLPGLSWAMQGTGNMDYELFLAHISKMTTDPAGGWPDPIVYVEFLRSAEEYQEAQRNIRAIASKIGVKIHGTQQPQQA
jgi:sugar phosphate isomerase/epimerase